MTISVPIEGVLASTDVEDTTGVWVNTSSEAIDTDATFQYDNRIFQNITLAPIPVFAYDIGDTYNINDLVFTDLDPDGVTTLPEPLVHKITATTGDFPMQPEDYIAIPTDTDYDDSTWDARYMKMGDIPLGASLHGVSYVFPTQPYVTSFRYSYNGLKLFIGARSTSGSSAVYECSLTEAYNTDTIYDIYAYDWNSRTTIVDLDISDDGFHLANTIRTDAGTTCITRSWTLNTANTVKDGVGGTSYFWTTANMNMRDNATAIKYGNNGLYLFGSTGGNIYQWLLTSPYNVTVINESAPTYTSPALSVNVKDFTFNANGTKVWVTSDDEVIREYDIPIGTAYRVSTMVYSGKSTIAKGFYGWHNQVSPDGSKLFTLAGDWVDDVIYTLDLFTPNDITTQYYSVFPFEHEETRNSIVYKYRLSWDKYVGTFKMETWRDGVYDNNTPLTHNTYVSEESVIAEEKANIGTNGVWLAKTLITRDGEGIYIRTNTDAAVETETLAKYRYQLVNNVSEISGMAEIGRTIVYNPFDDTNYTLATRYGSMTYTLQGTQAFDTIALGKVKADHILVEFFEAGSTTASTTIDRAVDSARDTLGNLPDWSTTLIYYSDTVLEPIGDLYPSVKITLTYTDETKLVELGTLLVGISAAAGFTNLTLANQYKDYSTLNYTDFGTDYVERGKVSKYTGTADVRIEDYDMTDRLMTSLGANLVILNGSDAKNTAPDSKTIFSATQKIGRFTSFSQKTKISDNDLDVMATYSFTLEQAL